MGEMILGVLVLGLIVAYALRRSFSSFKDADSCAGCSLNCPSKQACPSVNPDLDEASSARK